MTGTEWLNELVRCVGERSVDVAITHVSSNTFTLALGTRGITAHDAGDAIWLGPSVTTGPSTTRLQDRVQHLDIREYGINEQTIDVALDAVFSHLLGA